MELNEHGFIEFSPEDPLVARGQYATVNGELRRRLKDLNEALTNMVSSAGYAMRVDSQTRITELNRTSFYLSQARELSNDIDSLTKQKDGLYDAAWGNPVEEADDPLPDVDPI